MSADDQHVDLRLWWGAFVTLLAIVAVILGAVAVTDDGKAASSAGAASGASAGTAPTAPSSTATRTLDVELGDLYVRPSSLSVDPGTTVVLNITNHGQSQHNLVTEGGGPKTPLLDAGGTATLTVGPVTKAVTLFCDIPGHRAAGMELTITPSSTDAAADGGTASDGSSATASTAVPGAPKLDFTLTMPAGSTPRDPNAPPPTTGTVHEMTLHATEQQLEVAPGVRQQMWTFNGQVPGPTLRGEVGDTFRITLVNDGTLGHSIDFHASQVAWNDEMRTIKPGESLVYEFTAGSSGIFMYHCGTAPALHHIGNGMYGAVIIDPSDVAPVDHEFVIVQSELYLGAGGGPGDLTRMAAENWDAVMFNGYVNQYRDHPIRVEPGQRIRVWVLDAGPSNISAFHVVGTIFDTVFKEGAYLLRPGPSSGGSQVLDLAPAQGGFVEFRLAENGLYPMVSHKFSDPGKGALGLFQAGDVATTGSAAH